MMVVVDIDENIPAYEAMKADLEAASMGKWVLIHDRELFGIYDSFQAGRRGGRSAIRPRSLSDSPSRSAKTPPVTVNGVGNAPLGVSGSSGAASMGSGVDGAQLLVNYGPAILVDIGFDVVWKLGVSEMVPIGGIRVNGRC